LNLEVDFGRLPSCSLARCSTTSTPRLLLSEKLLRRLALHPLHRQRHIASSLELPHPGDLRRQPLTQTRRRQDERRQHLVAAGTATAATSPYGRTTRTALARISEAAAAAAAAARHPDQFGPHNQRAAILDGFPARQTTSWHRRNHRPLHRPPASSSPSVQRRRRRRKSRIAAAQHQPPPTTARSRSHHANRARRPHRPIPPPEAVPSRLSGTAARPVPNLTPL
jgi:hypothetical protein